MKHKLLLWAAIGVLFLTAGIPAVFSQETADQAPAEETSTSTALMIDPEIDSDEDEEPDCE